MDIKKITDGELILLKEQIKIELALRRITPKKEFEFKNRGNCSSCGKSIVRRAKMCKECAYKNRDNSKMYLNLPKDQTLKKHPRWKGGAYSYRKLIGVKECSNCGITKNLEVHHIDGDRKNNNKDNLMVLCSSCHHKIHFDYNKHRDNLGRFS